MLLWTSLGTNLVSYNVASWHARISETDAVVARRLERTDRIANTERHLDLAKSHNDRAVDETKELEALNRSIFRPTCE